jgi:pilus assembly protein CpaB
MNRNRLLVGLAIAIVLAFLLSSFVYKQFRQVTSVVPVKMESLVVAAVPMQVGVRLDPNNLRVISWPSNQKVAGMFTRVEDCVNRALITPVAENEPILEAKLAPKEAGAGLPATIPEGMRALSVAVNDVVAVAGFVSPGTMVDVLVTGQVPGRNDNVTRTLLENVRVLAAGQKIEQDRDGKPQTVPVITLLVSPDDAAKLTMASTQGKIQLALRNTIDSKKTDPAPVLQATIFSVGVPLRPIENNHPRSKKPQAAPPPPSLYVVEVISGTKHENKTFTNTQENK